MTRRLRIEAATELDELAADVLREAPDVVLQAVLEVSEQSAKVG